MKRLLVIPCALGLALAGAASAQDSDSDGVADAHDNCVNVSNPSQLDTNYDGYGNRCDPDTPTTTRTEASTTWTTRSSRPPTERPLPTST